MQTITLKYRHTIVALILFTIFILFNACKKDWLDAKPDQALVVPNDLDALESLINNSVVFNFDYQPALSEVGTTDYFITDETFANRRKYEQNIYTGRRQITSMTDLIWKIIIGKDHIKPFIILMLFSKVLPKYPVIRNIADGPALKVLLFFRAHIRFTI